MNRDLPKRVLLLLLDQKRCREIESALKEAGFEVTVALEAHQVMRLMRKTNPQFIIINSSIAETADVDLRRNIRSVMNLSDIRIITLSERENSRHGPQSPAVGSDFDLREPFAMEDLVEALELLQTRHPTRIPRKVLTAGAIELVPEEWLVYVDGHPVNLTEKEYRLLQELMEVKGRVLTREALLERVWGYQKVFNLETRTLDVHMSRLRTKLGSSACNIVTVRNVGYRMNLTPEWLNR